jgi:hypothetical protein
MNSQLESNKSESAHSLLPMIFGALQGKALTLMAELNIAEYLSKEPMDIEVLATATGTDPVALDRYLCLLTHLGLVCETDNGLYKCTQLGALLQKNKPSSLHNYPRMTNSDIVLEMIRHLDKALVSGESVFTSIYGERFYNALRNKPEEVAIFDGAMREISGQDIPEMRKFARCRS